VVKLLLQLTLGVLVPAQTQLMECLARNGGDVNAVDNERNTALHYARAFQQVCLCLCV
jgi:hypothetical protein